MKAKILALIIGLGMGLVFHFHESLGSFTDAGAYQ